MPATVNDPVAIIPDRFGSSYAYGCGVGTFQLGVQQFIACSNPASLQIAWGLTPDGTPPDVFARARILMTSDSGLSWEELDEAGAPEISTYKIHGTSDFRGLFTPIGACYKDAATLYVAYFKWSYVYGDPAVLAFSEFDLTTGLWGAEVSGGPTTNTALTKNMSICIRSTDGAIVFMWNGNEVVSGNKQRNFYAVYNGGWSAAAPVDTAQTGSTDKYGMYGVVAGTAGRVHFFWQVSPAFVVNMRTLTSGGALQSIVQISTDVADGQYVFGAVPSAPAAWNAGANIGIAYVKTETDQVAYASVATSANVPVFSESAIGGVGALILMGLTGNGQITNGLVAVITDGVLGYQAFSSDDGGATWDSGQVLTFPASPGGPQIFGFYALGITNGQQSGGFVANAWLFLPE